MPAKIRRQTTRATRAGSIVILQKRFRGSPPVDPAARLYPPDTVSHDIDRGFSGLNARPISASPNLAGAVRVTAVYRLLGGHVTIGPEPAGGTMAA
jgi:hypothetical protein